MLKFLGIAAVLAVVVPVLALALGLAFDYGIASCLVDEGAGARGCILLGIDISDAVVILQVSWLFRHPFRDSARHRTRGGGRNCLVFRPSQAFGVRQRRKK